MGAGKFDGLSHNELYAMVADANPSQLTEMGSALSEASMELNAISDLLRHHVERVKWEGEGGDAFREWGAEMVKQAAKLADYTVFAGSYIGQAGNGLSEVKSAMPKPDPTAECLTDPEKEQARLKASESNRQEAINLMNKLDSYYRVAHEGLAGLEEPRFRPMPLNNAGIGIGDDWERPYGDSGAAGRTGPGADGAYPSVAEASGSSISSTHTTQPRRGDTPAGKGAGMVSDSASTVLPHASSEPGQVTGTAIDSTGVAASPPDLATRPGIAVAPDAPQHSGATPWHPGPIASGVPLPSMSSSREGRTTAVLPSGPTAGGSARGSVPVPRSGGIPRTGGSDGIVGGTPTRSGGDLGSQRLPRGMVVGEEHGGLNRGPVGMGGPASNAGGGAPNSQRFGPSRRLAMEPGGVMAGPHGNGQSSPTGSRLPRGTVAGAEHETRAGAADVSRARRGDRADFTPGGSGLVRENPVPGPLHSGAAAGGGGRRRAVSRPDYLAEDEETWVSGRRDTVPPVIE